MSDIDFASKRALVVDDISNMRTTLREMLHSIGVKRVDDVGHGEQAVDALARGDYDIVLCDYNLGRGKNGQQVLEEARYRGLIRLSTVFIMVTAESTQQNVLGTFEHLPDDYLTKPFSQAILAKRLERQMVRRQGLRAIDYAASVGAFDKAVELCDARIAANIGNPDEIYHLKLDFCLRLERLDEAEKTCREALDRTPVAWALNGLGRVARLRGDAEAARGHFLAAIELMPSYMVAYDELAESYVDAGQDNEAIAWLQKALALSPNAINRQRRLGELAAASGEHEIAEQAYRSAASLGKGSVFRSHKDYAELAKIQAGTGAPETTVEQTLREMRMETRGNDEARIDAALAEADVQRDLGHAEAAQAAYERAAKTYHSIDGAISAEVALELGQRALAYGDTDLGMAAVQRAVKNHHDDERILRQARAIFCDSGLGQQGDQAIKAVTDEVRKKNNRGVALAKKGELEEAAALFDEALKELALNVTVNLNAAQVYLMLAKNGIGHEVSLARARACLSRVRKLDPSHDKLRSLSGVLERIQGDH